MGNFCSHCNKAIPNACSAYSGPARVQALQSCSNISETDRFREAAGCDGATQGDKELAICMALIALGGGEAIDARLAVEPPERRLLG
jgi:hypothetical protein